MKCEFCNKTDKLCDELIADIDNCEMYAHKKCLDKSRKLLKIDWYENN